MGGATSAPMWTTLLPVLRRFRVRLVLRNVEPLRVGAGSEPVAPHVTVNLPILLTRHPATGLPTPIVPGSSMKGVARTHIMSVALGFGITAHSGLRNDNCWKYLGLRKPDSFRREVIDGERSIDDLRLLLYAFCPTCLMFGAASLKGRVEFSAFLPPPEVPARISTRTAVGIDRRKGVSARNILYSYEYVEPGTPFEGVISGVNVTNWMLALLADFILTLDSKIIRLGGMKSRGHGAVEVDWSQVSVELSGVGVRSSTIDPLDEGVDDPISVPSNCMYSSGRLTCKGVEAHNLLEELRNSLESMMEKLSVELGKRRELAKTVLGFEVGELEGGEGW